jgi:vacuolar-type H+-ATPase subunit I/STV1
MTEKMTEEDRIWWEDFLQRNLIAARKSAHRSYLILFAMLFGSISITYTFILGVTGIYYTIESTIFLIIIGSLIFYVCLSWQIVKNKLDVELADRYPKYRRR